MFPSDRFLVGEGARRWARGKGVALPVTIAEAEEVPVLDFFLFMSVDCIFDCNYTFRVCHLKLCTLHILNQQWLVTERTKTQWEKYKEMVNDARAEKKTITEQPMIREPVEVLGMCP